MLSISPNRGHPPGYTSGRVEPDEVHAPAPAVTRAITSVLALIGALISTYLLMVKLGLTGPVVCGLSGGCSVVQASRYASMAGVPVPLIGLVGYLSLTTIALAGCHLRFARDRRVSLALLFVTGTAFAYSAFLTALEAFVIHAWCRWCLGSAAIATICFIATIIGEVRLLRSPRDTTN